MLKVIKRRLKIRYFKNRTEVYKYDVKNDPPVKKVVNRNKEIRQKRDKFAKEDKRFRDKSKNDIKEDSVLEPFDLSGHSSIFSSKDGLAIQAYTTDPKYGRLTKAGIVQKIINNKYHQRWLILRSFFIYFYQGSYSSQAKEVVSLPISALTQGYADVLKTECLIMENSKGRSVSFACDEDWIIAIENEMAHKRYMLYTWKENRKQTEAALEYFENENCRLLDLSHEELKDSTLINLMYKSLFYHAKLKEINFANCQIRGKLLKDLIESLINLKKYNKIEALTLDSNGITKETMEYVHRYLNSDSSFTLKKLSLNYNPIGDEGVQTFVEVLCSRFDKMNSSSKSKLELPLAELSLNGTKMGDQSVFTLITMFENVTKMHKDRGVEDPKELLTLRMADNLISDNGMTAFSYAIASFRALKELDLSNNSRVTSKSFSYLLNSLRKSTSVSRLDYLKNALDVKTLEKLFSSLADNFLLKRLSITLTDKLIEAFIVDKEVIRDFYKITT